MGRTSNQHEPQSQISQTHNLQNQITAVGEDSFTYDASGNLTSDQLSRATAYDAWNRLASAATANYEYDALGRRIEVTYSSPTTDPAVDFYYSNQGQVLEERESGASVAKRQYVWSAVYVDAMVLRDQDSGTDGTLDERLYVQQDANFNVTSVIDTSGTVVERYTYEAFGQFTVIDADWSSDADGVSDVGWVHLHQGGRWDANAKLYHFGARDYDPELARWTSPDPLGYVDGANLYQYEVSNPTGMLDPMGTWGFNGAVGSVSGSGGGGPGAVAIEKPSEGARVSHFANATTQPATDKGGTGPGSGAATRCDDKPGCRGKDPKNYPPPPTTNPAKDKKDASGDCNCQLYALSGGPNSGRPYAGDAERKAMGPDGKGKYPNGISQSDYEKNAPVLADVLDYWFANPESSIQGYRTTKDESCPAGWHKIAAYSRGNDYHYITQNADGKWYEKVSNRSAKHVWEDPNKRKGLAGYWCINTPARTCP